MHLIKSFYGKMFFECLIHKEPASTIVMLPGFPASNRYKDKMKFLFDKGYNVFSPMFIGSFQSEGNFLEENPVLELQKFIQELRQEKVTNLWDMSEVELKIKDITVWGGSFSGAISCGLCAIEPSIKKLVLYAPVWNFKKHNCNGDEQNLNNFLPFIKRAFNNLYRIKFDNLIEHLSKIKEISPEFYLPKLKIPILVFHDPNDETVSIRHTKEMKNKIKEIKVVEHNYGHGRSMSLIREKEKIIDEFLKSY